MVKAHRYENEMYRHNRRIIEYLQKVAGNNELNRFITLSFTYSKYGTPLRKHDVLMISRYVGAFFNTLSERLNGRRRKYNKEDRPKVPAIGFPEYRNESNGETNLHYHCLIKIPDDKLEYVHEITKNFWKKVVKNTVGYPPKIDSRPAYCPKGAAFYSNKNIESGFTIENSVFHGISLS